jgi:hypothetical protein
MARFTPNKPGLLLGEGKDEVGFFNALLLEMGLSDLVQVIDYGGVAKLRDSLTDLSRTPGMHVVRCIVVTRDADEDASSALTSLQHLIASSPVADRVTGHFVLPDNQRPGALEALWLESLQPSEFTPCVDEFFRCIEACGWKPSQLFAKNDKARAQLYIATKDTPNERFGLAAWHGRKETDREWMREKWIDFDHPAFGPLKQFLENAFASLRDQHP